MTKTEADFQSSFARKLLDASVAFVFVTVVSAAEFFGRGFPTRGIVVIVFLSVGVFLAGDAVLASVTGYLRRTAEGLQRPTAEFFKEQAAALAVTFCVYVILVYSHDTLSVIGAGIHLPPIPRSTVRDSARILAIVVFVLLEGRLLHSRLVDKS